MGWIKNVLLLTVLICVQNLRAQTNVLKPDKVFDLYFNAFVKHNDQSLTELNDYLKNFIGEEGLYKVDMKTAYREELKGLTNLFLSGFSENVAKECEPDVKNYFNALFDRFKSARYTIKNMETMRNDYSQSQDISEVYYEVMVKIPENKSNIDLKNGKKISAKELKIYLKDITNQLLSANKEFSLSEKFNLYQIYKNDKVYYWNGGPQELLWKLNNFYFQNFNSNKIKP
ncbi:MULTISPECIES: hypothetical protein [unclassified Chryseobacterium]|uniref:hypothetical protein n=1 Tax=unclassified Chryseobacterium TaxID=2593645 RepID=UPI00226AF465|nr:MULTISPECIES: hypothetical protein [unclassified Chryseobacterium]